MAPKPVATDGFISVDVGGQIAMPPPAFRAYLKENPLTDHLEPSGSIAEPVDIVMLRGTWPEPDATRRVELSDGHYVIERAVEDRPDLFRYQIYHFTNEAGRGVDQIVGEMRFLETPGGGTDWQWSYNVRPKNWLTRPFVARFVERELRPYLEGGAAGMTAAANAAATGAGTAAPEAASEAVGADG